ncbi:unnamed protein product [Camellia sinensis]
MGRKRMIPVVVVVLFNLGITPFIPLVFTLLLVIPHFLIKAKQQDLPLYHFYINGNYTTGGGFEDNLKRLLIWSLYNNGGVSIFSNVTQGDDPDKAYGLFLCRGDVQPSICNNCIDTAGVEILRRCSPKKEAIIWYDECFIHNSNGSFFSTMETDPQYYMWNTKNVTQPDKFNEIFGKTYKNLF